MARHRVDPPLRVRPRLGRIAVAGASLSVTVVALLGGIGLIPAAAGNAASPHHTAVHRHAATLPPTAPATTPTPSATVGTSLPAASGSGRRAVFSIRAQRVWLVNAQGKEFSTYLVSGSLTNNLKPGTYHVFSRQRRAIGVDDSGVMQYFVVFAHGQSAAIGFHAIPTKGGRPLQTTAQLGTPQSHGCIRQNLADAVRLWGFASIGTVVVVVA